MSLWKSGSYTQLLSLFYIDLPCDFQVHFITNLTKNKSFSVRIETESVFFKSWYRKLNFLHLIKLIIINLRYFT